MDQLPESILEQQSAEPEKPKNKWKIRVAFVAIIFLVLGAVIGARAYKLWKEVDDADLFAVKMAELKKMQEADTFGGATPYETLEMYISALEKGDYALASKYFVIENQEKELANSLNAPKENMLEFIGTMKESVNSKGSYSDDNKEFLIREPVFINFILYPKGIWKITEI